MRKEDRELRDAMVQEVREDATQDWAQTPTGYPTVELHRRAFDWAIRLPSDRLEE